MTVRSVFLGTLLALLALPLAAAPVRGSKHDLSSPWDYSDQVCAFCHTPHSSNRLGTIKAPLWNRFVDQTKVYVPYASSTLNTAPGDVTQSVSLLCLGCHDGTLGTAIVGAYSGSDKHDLVNAPGPGGIPDTTSWPNCERCHPEYYGEPAVQWIGTDLRKSHPIAMTYPTAAQDPKFNLPPDLTTGWTDVKLWSGKVECPTCHEPHDPSHVPFLRKSNVASALCLTCHRK